MFYKIKNIHSKIGTEPAAERNQFQPTHAARTTPHAFHTNDTHACHTKDTHACRTNDTHACHTKDTHACRADDTPRISHERHPRMPHKLISAHSAAGNTPTRTAAVQSICREYSALLHKKHNFSIQKETLSNLFYPTVSLLKGELTY